MRSSSNESQYPPVFRRARNPRPEQAGSLVTFRERDDTKTHWPSSCSLPLSLRHLHHQISPNDWRTAAICEASFTPYLPPSKALPHLHRATEPESVGGTQFTSVGPATTFTLEVHFTAILFLRLNTEGFSIILRSQRHLTISRNDSIVQPANDQPAGFYRPKVTDAASLRPPREQQHNS